MRASPRSRQQSNEMIGGLIASPSIDKFAAFVTRDYIDILACPRGITLSVGCPGQTARALQSHLNASTACICHQHNALQMHAEREMARAELNAHRSFTGALVKPESDPAGRHTVSGWRSHERQASS